MKRNMHPNSLANLRPAKPGEVRNPKGGISRDASLIKAFINELGKVSFNGVSLNVELIAAVVVGVATKGNLKAVEILASYLHARPTAGVELSSKDDKPLFVAVLSRLRGLDAPN